MPLFHATVNRIGAFKRLPSADSTASSSVTGGRVASKISTLVLNERIAKQQCCQSLARNDEIMALSFPLPRV